jgi:hypothetical protein
MNPQVPNPNPYFHRDNIPRGNATILYAEADVAYDGVWRPAGWVLLGGKRTSSRDDAEAYAWRVSALYSQLEAQRPKAGETWP